MPRFTLATKITFSRIVFAILAIIALYGQFPYNTFVALAFFVIAIITDFFDGRVARARKEVSKLGIFLDPLIDKLMVLSVMIALIQFAVLPAWLVILTLFRELIVTSFRDFAGTKGISIPSVMSGKIKSCLQFLAIAVGISALCVLDFQIMNAAPSPTGEPDVGMWPFLLRQISILILGLSVAVGYFGMWQIFSKNLKKVLAA